MILSFHFQSFIAQYFLTRLVGYWTIPLESYIFWSSLKSPATTPFQVMLRFVSLPALLVAFALMRVSELDLIDQYYYYHQFFSSLLVLSVLKLAVRLIYLKEELSRIICYDRLNDFSMISLFYILPTYVSYQGYQLTGKLPVETPHVD